MKRRTLLAAPAVLALAKPAFAQAYPNKSITMVVPFAAGGPTDLMARIMGEGMGKRLGQTFVIDNTTGAAGTIATTKVVRAAADGYTISIGHVGTHTANGTIYKNLNYSFLDDLVPIVRLPQNPMLVIASMPFPPKTLKEAVEYLKANPDKVSGGTAGMGSGSHLGSLFFNSATGAKYQLIPYRGTGPAIQDLISNQIQIMVDQTSNSLPQVQGGKVKAYAITAKERSKAAPDIPTAAEAGYPGLELSIWHGLWAPKGTPADAIAKLNAAAVETLNDPAVRKRMEELGQDIPTAEEMKPATFAAFHRAEFAKWKAILEAAGVKAE
jgi:tripartite-type tricarboxylate transporter receptor subunit TctC